MPERQHIASRQIGDIIDSEGRNSTNESVEVAERGVLTAEPPVRGAVGWIGEVGGLTDLSINIDIVGQVVKVSIDRSDPRLAWWPASRVPCLTIVLSAIERKATALASAGGGPDFQQVVLGQTRI